MTDRRPVTLFTGQWTDLPLERVAALASEWGYDGLEIACSDTHLDIARALDEDDYLDSFRATLDAAGLGVWAISNHVAGHAVADPTLDFRMQSLMPPRLWGDGAIEAVQRRAAEEMKNTARVAARLGVKTVVGFTGSPIWRYVVGFPGASEEVIEAGFREFADRWNPILDVFDEVGVRFAFEVHPSEIAYDYWTAVRSLEAIGRRPAFGFNWDPSHLLWQGIDPANFIMEFKDRIYHVDCKDTRLRPATGRSGILGSHLSWGDPRRAWDFVSVGRGDVPWSDAFRALDAIGYDGPISIEWEDAGMDRLHAAAEAVQFVRSMQWPLPTMKLG